MQNILFVSSDFVVKFGLDMFFFVRFTLTRHSCKFTNWTFLFLIFTSTGQNKHGNVTNTCWLDNKKVNKCKSSQTDTTSMSLSLMLYTQLLIQKYFEKLYINIFLNVLHPFREIS